MNNKSSPPSVIAPFLPRSSHRIVSPPPSSQPKDFQIVDTEIMWERFCVLFPTPDPTVVLDKVVIAHHAKITKFMEELRSKQNTKDFAHDDRLRFLGMKLLLESNALPAFQGVWRKIPYKER